MLSEVIVLSSDDEDEDWLATKHKRSKIQHVDADLAVVEKGEVESPKQNNSYFLKSTEAKPAHDDDCCILSYNPDDSVYVPEFQAHDADDLVIVGERGPVACRDFPHARHLCVKFPYATTPHEKHCEQCHCYVCDVLAPCIYWGQGRQSSDHCHALDKDDKWKKLRSQNRSRLAKLSIRPQISVRHQKMVQPESRTFLNQAPTMAKFVPGQNGCLQPLKFNSNMPSHNRGSQNLSGMHANWHPYIPLDQRSMLVNSTHGNWIANRENSSCCVENSFDVTENMARGFVEQRNIAVNGTTTSLDSAAPQLGSQQQCPAVQQVPHTIAQSLTYRQVPISPNSSTAAPQPKAHLPYFTSSQIHQFQAQRNASFSEVPYNHGQLLHGSSEMIQSKSSAPSVGNIQKDLMTLQNYLLEGISGPLRQLSAAQELGLQDKGHLCVSGDSVVQMPLQTVHHLDVDSQHNPVVTSEILPSDNAAARFCSAHGANTGPNKQVDKGTQNVPLNGATNKKNSEHQVDDGREKSNSLLLDHILAGFDEDFWTLLEPAAYSGF